MKVLTEFSGTVIRLAAQATEEVRASLPVVAEQVAPPTPDVAPEGDAPVEAPVAVAQGDSDEVKAALDEAIGKATGIAGERATRLREALGVVGTDLKEVRLVRVYSAESPLSGAKVVGEHQYVVDLMPKTMKPSFGRPGHAEKGGRRGDRSQRGPGSGSRDEGPLDGAFSMDTVKSDRGGRRGRS